MRAITIRQPWAWAIVNGTKGVENRSRNIAGSYRGPVAIHTSLALALVAMRDPRIVAEVPIDVDRDEWPEMPMGAFVGLAELVDVHPADGCCRPWGEPTGFHLVLENRRPIEPFGAKGKLGLWRPDPEQMALIHR